VRARSPVFAALLLPFALLLGCQSDSLPHEAESTEATAPEQGKAKIIERTLAIEVAGQTLGMLETRLEKAPDGSRTGRELVTFSVVREGGGEDAAFSSTSETVMVCNPQNELVSEVQIEREAGITITRTVTIEGTELISTYSGPGREDTKRFPLPPDYANGLKVDLELIEEWKKTGKPATRKYSSFDSDRERFELTEVTITGETEFVLGNEKIPAYVFRSIEEDGTVMGGIFDQELTPLKISAAGTFVATAVVDKPELGGGGGRINAELPVTGKTTGYWGELARQEVTVTVEGDDASGTALWDQNHYHQVVREGSRYSMTLLSTRPGKDFVAPQLPLKISDPEINRFLAATANSQSDDQAIVGKAKQIVGDERNAMLAAARIVESVYETIDKQAGVRGSATATEVLENGAGDCTEHAVLVVALMRAAGIPARMVDGIVILSHPDGTGVAGYHAWAEIWLGQWIGVDATVNETGTSARYLMFGVDEPGMISSAGRMMRAMGKTSIELGPHQTYEQLR
jgi:hypothetical protein